MTIREARAHGRGRLAAHSPTPELDADVLLMHVLQCDRTRLLFRRDEQLSGEAADAFEGVLATRATGLPVAYITGRKEFYGYPFAVTPAVLIPKPDTEILVEKALIIIEEKLHAHPSRPLHICDMCTGSGCIGLSIVKAAAESGVTPPHTALQLVLADISGAALDVARTNRDALFAAGGEAAKSIRLVRSNLFAAVTGSYDLITANPPYIPAAEARCLLADGRGEPLLALDGDSAADGLPTGTGDGLGVMRNLVPQASARLVPGGALLVESGEYNAPETERIFQAAGLTRTRIWRDLSGQLRVTEGWKPI